MNSNYTRGIVFRIRTLVKAGSYGIQGEGGKFVVKYDGDFDTIMGLSLALCRELIERAFAD